MPAGPDSEPTRPLYDRIKREIRAAIAHGDHPPETPFITQREVCERYGVSTTTAVRALNELVAEGVLVRRRGKGTFVAEERPAAPADARDRAVACIVHGLDGKHVSEVVRGVESACVELGYRMFLSESDGSPEREGRALQQALDTGAAGVVLYPVEGAANLDRLEDLRRRRVPIVLVDRYRTDVATDAVMADNFAVGYQLTQRLLELGHRRIATLWSETQCTSVTDRLTGHKQAMSEHGLPIQPELTILRPYWPQPEPARRAMLTRMLDGSAPPTALLCANGYVLAAAANDLVALGVEIPGQVDLAAMDDAGPYDILPLTSVAAALPSREIGRRAMVLLASRFGTEDPYQDVQHVQLPAEIRSRPGVLTYVRAAGAAGADSS